MADGRAEVDMSGEAVTRRLRAVGALYRPLRLEELDGEAPPSRDLSPATVTARLNELRELLRLTRWLQGGVCSEEPLAPRRTR